MRCNKHNYKSSCVACYKEVAKADSKAYQEKMKAEKLNSHQEEVVEQEAYAAVPITKPEPEIVTPVEHQGGITLS